MSTVDFIDAIDPSRVHKGVRAVGVVHCASVRPAKAQKERGGKHEKTHIP